MTDVVKTNRNKVNLPSRGFPVRIPRTLVSIHEPENAQAVAGRIRKARQAAGLSREELARIMLVHPKTIANWESPSKPTLPDKLGQLAQVLRTTPQWILWGEAPPEPTVEEALLAFVALVEEQTALFKRLERFLERDGN